MSLFSASKNHGFGNFSVQYLTGQLIMLNSINSLIRASFTLGVISILSSAISQQPKLNTSFSS